MQEKVCVVSEEVDRRKVIEQKRRARARSAKNKGKDFVPRIWLRDNNNDMEMQIVCSMKLLLLAHWHHWKDGVKKRLESLSAWQIKFLSEEERLLPSKEKWILRYARDEEYRANLVNRQKQRNRADPTVQRNRAHRRRARLRKQHDGTVSAKTIRGLVKKMKGCLYCGIKLSQGDAVIDHMVPVSKGGLHSKNNIAVSCYGCNSLKLNRDFDEWVEMLGEPFKSRAIRYYEKTAGRKVEQRHLLFKFGV